MTEHVPSNFATYQDSTGRPVWETWFLRVDEVLYAYPSWDIREEAINEWIGNDMFPVALSHREAHSAIQAGFRAYAHLGGESLSTGFSGLFLATRRIAA